MLKKYIKPKEELEMTNNTNASPEVFGFDFQVNATIFYY